VSALLLSPPERRTYSFVYLAFSNLRSHGTVDGDGNLTYAMRPPFRRRRASRRLVSLCTFESLYSDVARIISKGYSFTDVAYRASTTRAYTRCIGEYLKARYSGDIVYALRPISDRQCYTSTAPHGVEYRRRRSATPRYKWLRITSMTRGTIVACV
jgi:hypothetical protein